MSDPTPTPATPPGSGEIPPPPPVNPVDSTTGLPPNIAAALAAFLPLLAGIVFLVLEKRNAFVRFWAMQSVFFGGVCLVFSIVMQVLIAILLFIPLLGHLLVLLLGIASFVIGLGCFVIWVITIVQAFQGKEWEIPYLGPLARKQLAGQPVP